MRTHLILLIFLHFIKICTGISQALGQSILEEKPGEQNARNTIGGKFSVGQICPEGIIFRLDATGNHGLMASTEIFNTGITRSINKEIDTFARVDGFNAGKRDTKLLLAVRPGNKSVDYSKMAAANYSLWEKVQLLFSKSPTKNGYDDWYLPSRFELKLLYENLQKIGVPGFTSIQFLDIEAIGKIDPWVEAEFNDANPFTYENDSIYVLPIRSF